MTTFRGKRDNGMERHVEGIPVLGSGIYMADALKLRIFFLEERTGRKQIFERIQAGLYEGEHVRI